MSLLAKLKGHVHEAAKRHRAVAKLLGKKPRSPQWHKVQREFLKKNLVCAACGGTFHLQVHHKLPFHIHPELELEESNLITLCMAEFDCHLKIGHGDSFQAFNPEVALDSPKARANPDKRDIVEMDARVKRRFA